MKELPSVLVSKLFEKKGVGLPWNSESTKCLLRTCIFSARNYLNMQSLVVDSPIIHGGWCTKVGDFWHLLRGICSLHWIRNIELRKRRKAPQRQIPTTHRDTLKAIFKETQPENGERKAILSYAIEDMAWYGSLKKPGIGRQIEYEMRYL